MRPVVHGAGQQARPTSCSRTCRRRASTSRSWSTSTAAPRASSRSRTSSRRSSARSPTSTTPTRCRRSRRSRTAHYRVHSRMHVDDFAELVGIPIDADEEGVDTARRPARQAARPRADPRGADHRARLGPHGGVGGRPPQPDRYGARRTGRPGRGRRTTPRSPGHDAHGSSRPRTPSSSTLARGARGRVGCGRGQPRSATRPGAPTPAPPSPSTACAVSALRPRRRAGRRLRRARARGGRRRAPRPRARSRRPGDSPRARRQRRGRARRRARTAACSRRSPADARMSSLTTPTSTPERHEGHGRAVLSVLAAATLFGTTGTAQALGPSGTTPLGVGAARIVVGGAGLVAILPWIGGSRRDALALWRTRWGLTAGLTTAIYQVCFFAGVSRAGVALGTLVTIGSGPVFTGLLSWALLRERLRLSWVVATAVCVLGLALLVGSGATQRRRRPVRASLLALASGLGYAVYTVAAKRLMTAGHRSDEVMAARVLARRPGAGAGAAHPAARRGSATPSGAALALWLGLGDDDGGVRALRPGPAPPARGSGHHARCWPSRWWRPSRRGGARRAPRPARLGRRGARAGRAGAAGARPHVG